MFPRAQRLTDSRLFQSVFRKGVRSKGRSFTIFMLPASKKGRIGFVITKKVSKSSVVRNRAKRRLRSVILAVAKEPQFTNLLQNSLLVVLIHRPNDDVSYEALTHEVTTALARLTGTKV